MLSDDPTSDFKFSSWAFLLELMIKYIEVMPLHLKKLGRDASTSVESDKVDFF